MTDPETKPEQALRQLDCETGADVRRALQRVLMLPEPRGALLRLQAAGVLAAVLPEVDATVALAAQAQGRHKDVWAHTALVVSQSPARPVVRWAALLHDIGKVRTRRFEPDGTVTFLGHAEEGAALFRSQIASRLAFPPEQVQEIHALIASHQRPSQYSAQWQDSAVRRFCRDLGSSVPDLLDLSRADVTSRIPGRREAILGLIDELAGRIKGLAELDSRVAPLPSGLGDAIMQRFGLTPGPRIGELRRALEQAVEDGALQPGQNADYYVEYLERSGLAVRSSSA